MAFLMKKKPFKNGQNKTRLIQAALRQIPFEGWTETAFAKAEEAEGLPAGTYARQFPEGVQQFIEAFQEWVDSEMLLAAAGEKDFEKARVRDKIFFLCMARFDALRPYREAVRRLLGHQMIPWNGAYAVRDVAYIADSIWRAAGDRSSDYNFYTKRALLAGVYITTLHVWLTDNSDGCAETERFLHAQIERVLKVGKWIGGLKERIRKAA